ncbi:MAG: MotA/TolQ/ExbB proton channel family protein [Rhizobiaceae bacterium]|nr:MotA/TolQ/ExbB proton channel family protein [Rhizobiaceae bacterium]
MTTLERPGATAAAIDAGYLRLRLYAGCLAASLFAHAFVHAASDGPLALGPVLLAIVALAACLVLPPPSASFGALLAAGTLVGAAAALVFPIGRDVAAGLSVPAAVRSTDVWPQILVTLFASRILAESADVGFSRYWQNPLSTGRRPRTQSMLAALLLGLCLTLAFYQLAANLSVEPGRLDPMSVTIRAFTGETGLHVAIVVLFFVVAAAILDAALLAMNDRAVLDAFRQLCDRQRAAGGRLRPEDIVRLIETHLPGQTHSRALAYVREAAGSTTEPRDPGRLALDSFHAASRRLIRALLSFLPLLGFLGTVIGLTVAIGGLPTDFSPGASSSLDVSSSLSGLAVKFETTLLGLTGGLLASLMLALVERGEQELPGTCRHLVAVATRDG